VVDGEIMLKRGSKPIHTLGTQGPYKIQVGPLEISGKLAVLNKDDAEFNYYLNNTTFPVSLLFTPPANPTNTVLLQMSTVKGMNAMQERGADELILTTLDLQPLPNSTDVVTGAGGVSPIKYVATTGLATTY
jgi:hypothetical protein